jgi:hypothetical protein
MQGYKHDGTTRTPNNIWITPINENSNWLTTNDPCLIEIGNGLRLPTMSEWNNIDAAGGWSNWNGPWNSALKIHAAGGLSGSNGNILYRGGTGYYWNSTIGVLSYEGQALIFNSTRCDIGYGSIADGFTACCIRQ